MVTLNYSTSLIVTSLCQLTCFRCQTRKHYKTFC